MRDSGRVQTLLGDDGKLIGLVLPGGGCAEHEVGIDRLLRHLSIPAYDDATTVGLEGRSMTAPAASHFLRSSKRQVTIGFGKKSVKAKLDVSILQVHAYDGEDAQAFQDRTWWVEEENEIRAQWSREGFALAGVGPVASQHVRDVAAALDRQDLAAWFGMLERNPFARPGLVLSIVSSVGADLREVMRKNDVDRIEFMRKVDEIGIVERVKTAAREGKLGLAGTHFMSPSVSVSPKAIPRGMTVDRDGTETTLVSVFDIVFYVTSSDRKFRSGYYTAEELDDWIQGRGPIPARMSAATVS